MHSRRTVSARSKSSYISTQKIISSMEKMFTVVPKGTGEAVRSAPLAKQSGTESELNGPNSGQKISNRKRRALNRAKAHSADGNEPPSRFIFSSSPRAVSFSCARNGAQETRPRSPASQPKSRGCNKPSLRAEETGQGREDSPRQRGRTKEGEDRIRPAGSMNRGRGMRAPDGLSPRTLMTEPASHAPRSEESCRAVKKSEDRIRPAGSMSRGRGMRAPDGPGPRTLMTGLASHVPRSEESRRTVKKRAISAEFRLAGLISRDQGMRAPAGLSPPELTAEQATSAPRSEENQLETGAPEHAIFRPAGSMNRARGTPTMIDADPRSAKAATADFSQAPKGENETRRKASDRFLLRIPAEEILISGCEMRAGKSTATLATLGGILGALIREEHNRGSSRKGDPTAVETLGVEARPRKSATPGGGRA